MIHIMNFTRDNFTKNSSQRVVVYIIAGVFVIGLLISLLSAVHWYMTYTRGVVYLGGTLEEISSSSVVLINTHGYTREIMYASSTRFVNRKELVTLESLLGKSLSVRAHHNSRGQLDAEVIRLIGKQKQ